MAKATLFKHKSTSRTRHSSKVLTEGSISTGKSGTEIGVWTEFDISVRGEGPDGRTITIAIQMTREEAQRAVESLTDMLQ